MSAEDYFPPDWDMELDDEEYRGSLCQNNFAPLVHERNRVLMPYRRIAYESPKAVLVEDDNGKVWIPKSVCDIANHFIHVQEWFYNKMKYLP